MRSILIIPLLFFAARSLNAQEIDFGSYTSTNFDGYTIELILGAGGVNGDLDFGFLMADSGPNSIDLLDAEVFELEIVGVEYLDVFVEISASYNSQLILDEDEGNIDDPEKSITLNLEAAYSNIGDASNSASQAIVIPLSNSSGSARFPIRRERFTAPGPPPPPPSGEFNQASVEDTAVLYLYGSLNVGDVDAGMYYGLVTIDVYYEFPD